MPSLIISRNPFDPSDRIERVVKTRARIKALAPSLAYPTICLYNGRPLRRAGWGRRLRAGDVVQFVAMPRGGDFKRTLLTIAGMVAAAYTGGLAAGAMGWTGGAMTFGQAMAAGFASAAVSMAGSALVNAILPPPKLPSAYAASELAAASPTYSLQAQGNSARIEQPIPVHYGRHIAYPDFAAVPYAEFVGNEQYLYQLLLVGQGEYDIEAIRIEKSPIADFQDITTEIVPPGGRVTLFPSEVTTAGEVSGQELSTVPMGPFASSPAGTAANAIGVDLVCPGGLYYGNDAGGLDARSVTVKIEARKISDLDVPIGSWITLGTETISGATNTPIRNSYRYTVAEGRWQVRAQRTDAKDSSARAAHVVLWGGLRAYLPGNQAYGDVTLIAMRMRASNQLSSQSTRKVNVVATRKLPTWSPGGGWSAPVATRSIAWALADVCRARYGADLADDRYDLAGLYALDAIWTGRGDKFDGRFDARQTVWEALTSVARAGRAKPYQQGGVICFWRDAPATIPVALFSPRNIARGSFRLEYAPASTDTSDAVRMAYWDEDVWTQRDVVCALPGSAAARPADVTAFGMVRRAQVQAEGLYMAAANRYRRRLVTFATELEGFIPRFGDLIAIAHDMPSWGQSGDVVGWDAGTLRLTLAEPPAWTAGATHYVRLVRADGSVTVPIIATQAVGDAYAVMLAAAPDFTPEVLGATRERTRYAFGVAGRLNALARVTRIAPKGAYEVEIGSVIEDDRVHAADTGAVVTPAPGSGLGTIPQAPTIASLTVAEGGDPARPELKISWPPAAGAERYVVESSVDGQHWSREADITATDYRLVASAGLLYVRVAGVGLIRGPWKTWTGTAGSSLAAPGPVTGLAQEEAFYGPVARIVWGAAARAARYRVEVWAGSPLSLRRSRIVADTRYAYTAADAAQDGGPWRALELRVTPIGTADGPTSAIALINAVPAAPAGLSAVAGARTITVSCAPWSDPDFAGIRIWLSTVSGFVPSDANLVYDGPALYKVLTLAPDGVPLVGGTQYYLRVAGYDAHGKTGLTLSSELGCKPLTITGSMQTGELTAEHVATRTLTGEHFQAESITANEIDTRGLTIRDAAGNVILGAGTGLDFAKVTGATKPLDNAGKVIDGGEGANAGQRGCNDFPGYYPVGKSLQFKWAYAIGIGGYGYGSNGYCTLETNKQWAHSSGGTMTQWAYCSDGATYKRTAAVDATSWGVWVRDLDRQSYTGDLDANKTSIDANGNIQGVSSGAGTSVSNSLVQQLTLIARMGCETSGNRAWKRADAPNSWDGDVYSRDSFVGGAYASFVPDVVGQHVMAGLNSDPTTTSPSADYTTLDYAFYVSGAAVGIYESGSDRGTVAWSYTTSTVFSVIYDGSSVRYLIDGSVVRTVEAPPNLTLYFDSAFAGPGSAISRIQFGPVTSRNIVTSATAAPSSPRNGDIWIDTSVTPNVLRTRISGVWQVGANFTTDTSQLIDGAGLGTTADWTGVSNRPDDPLNLLTKSNFENGLVGAWVSTAALTVMGVAGQRFSKALRFQARDTWLGSTFPVTGGERLYLGAMLNAEGTGNPVSMGVTYFSAAGSQIWDYLTAIPGGSGWTKVGGSLIVPATAVRAMAYLLIDAWSDIGAAAATDLYVSRFQPGATVGATFGNATGAGSNITGKLTTENQHVFIESLKIGNGVGSDITIDTAQLKLDASGNAEFAGSLAVKSAVSGARTEITTQVIKVIDSSGVVRVKLGNLAA